MMKFSVLLIAGLSLPVYAAPANCPSVDEAYTFVQTYIKTQENNEHQGFWLARLPSSINYVRLIAHFGIISPSNFSLAERPNVHMSGTGPTDGCWYRIDYKIKESPVHAYVMLAEAYQPKSLRQQAGKTVRNMLYYGDIHEDDVRRTLPVDLHDDVLTENPDDHIDEVTSDTGY